MPDSSCRLHQIMADLGPSSPDIRAVSQGAAESWTVLFADDWLVHLALRDGPSRLELAVCLGRLPQSPEAAIQLLFFNFLTAETGGARMGLSALNRQIHLFIDLPLYGIDLSCVRDTCRSLVAVGASWAQHMAGFEGPAFPTPSGLTIDERA
jgi:hypothetical protein